MIRAIALILALAAPSFEQNTQSGVPKSPCPNVFTYEPPGSEPGRWYGVVHLSTDSKLHSLWLNILLDNKADILGNWIGDVSTQDNMNFKIENTNITISPGPAVQFRFFVQYNPLKTTPKLRAIRMNGREICNANSPQPVSDGQDYLTPSIQTNSHSSSQRPQIRPQDIPSTRPVSGRPTVEDVNRPVYSRPVNSPNPSSISGGNVNSQNVNSRPNSGYPLTTTRPTRVTTRKPPLPDFENENVSTEDTEDDYFKGGQLTIVLPIKGSSSSSDSQNQQCGTVVLNKPNPLVVNGKPTLEGQWPWQIALYQTQSVDNKYLCGGTLVSRRHVITAAHCVTRKESRRVVNKNTLTVYLGKHNLRTSVDGVQIRFVEKITVYPEYNATTFTRDLAILELKEPVTYSDWVRPACLWPENQVDLSNVIGKIGSIVGWGFDETGVATEELSLVEMPVVDTETCIRSYSEFFVRFTSEYTYCAGYRDGSSVCNGDSGGGMTFKMGRSWYLRGMVSLSVATQSHDRCDPSHYIIFTDVAKFLPWIKENVYDY